MPDLHTQLREYARFAVDLVEPVSAAEVIDQPAPFVEATAAARAGRRRPRRRRRLAWAALGVAVTTGAVAAGVTAVLTPTPDEPVRVAVQPPPSLAPSTVPTTMPAAPSEPPPSTGSTITPPPGIAGARRSGQGQTAVKAVLVDGTAFWVWLPDDVPGLAELQVVPDAVLNVTGAIAPRTFLTTASAEQWAANTCTPPPSGPCAPPRPESRRVLPGGGTLTRWDNLTIEPELTLEMGGWTLVLMGPESVASERIASTLQWSVDGDGYLTFRSAEPDVQIRYPSATLRSGVTGEPADGLRITVEPGCDARPELNWPAVPSVLNLYPIAASRPAWGGLWCTLGQHRVEVTTGDRALVERLYAGLRIEPAR